MTKDSLTTDELKKQVGVEGPPEVYEIEKGLIRRFVQATDDPNPLWSDEDYARKGPYGGIIAPPTIIPVLRGLEQSGLLSTSPSQRLIHGSTELECYQPVKPSDKITITNKLVDIRERNRGVAGRMVFITMERSYKNQRKELVARCRQKLIRYENGDGQND
ncbi:MaoC family dehydratase N-terminal domain-containing protein [Chloroflexota bacterium]